MSNFIESLAIYPEGWWEKECRKFTEEELNAFRGAFIHEGDYGLNVCLLRKPRGKSFVPIARDSNDVEVGDTVDLSKAELVTLQYGDTDEQIYKIRV